MSFERRPASAFASVLLSRRYAAMRKLLTFLIALAGIALGVCSPAFADSCSRAFGRQGGTGCNSVITTSGGGGGLTVDGTPQSIITATSNTSTNATALVTTQTNDTIIVGIVENGFDATGVSGSTLGAFTKRATCFGACSGFGSEWFKVASSALAGETITVTYGGTITYSQGAVIAIHGANVSNPATPTMYDPNASLPDAYGGAVSTTATTTNANTMGISLQRLNASTTTIDSGWAPVINTNFFMMEYQIPTVGNSLTVNDATAAGGVILDAVTQ
jgi:hypothetical protein